MKLIVSKSSLLAALQSVAGVINNNTVIPILKDVLFEVSDAGLRLTATDLQNTLITTLKVEAKDYGSIAVPAKVLLDTLKTLPEQPLSIYFDTKINKMELVTEGGKYKISCEKAADFPKVPSLESAGTFNKPVEGSVLRSAIQKCMFAISDNDLRPAMTGMLLGISPTGTAIVATDAHKLVECTYASLQGPKAEQIIVAKKAVGLLKQLLASVEGTVEVHYARNHVFIQAGALRLISRLVDARYPDYAKVIPQNNPNVLRINRLELIFALRRIVLFSNKTTYQVILQCGGEKLQLSAQDIDFSNEATETLNCSYEGESLEIGFNARIVQESLQVLESDEVEIRMNKATNAAVLKPVVQSAGEEALILIMPVTIG